MSKPIWINVPRKDFDPLIKDVDDSLDNKNYKIKVGNNDYNLKNTKKFVKNSYQKNLKK